MQSLRDTFVAFQASKLVLLGREGKLQRKLGVIVLSYLASDSVAGQIAFEGHAVSVGIFHQIYPVLLK